MCHRLLIVSLLGPASTSYSYGTRLASSVVTSFKLSYMYSKISGNTRCVFSLEFYLGAPRLKALDLLAHLCGALRLLTASMIDAFFTFNLSALYIVGLVILITWPMSLHGLSHFGPIFTSQGGSWLQILNVWLHHWFFCALW